MNGCSPLIYNWRYILVALPATIRFSITTAPCDLRGGVNCGAWCNALGAILFWSWYGSDNNRVGEREGAETTNRNNNMLPSGVTSLFPVRRYSSNRKSFLNFRLYPRGADSVRWRKITHFHEGEQDHGWWPKSPFELAVLFFYFIPKKKSRNDHPVPGTTKIRVGMEPPLLVVAQLTPCFMFLFSGCYQLFLCVWMKPNAPKLGTE